ncbi:MAG: type II toxin-antitoxin system VapC family toxin [Candidatus Methanofastidiosia archaeon]
MDSSVFLVHFLEGRKELVEFFELNVGKLVTSGLVINEVMFILMKEHTKQELGLKEHYSILSAMKGEAFKKAFANASIFLELMEAIRCIILSDANYSDMVEMMNKYSLLPNDALIAATCKHYEIKKIATFDKDFERVDFLEVIKP